LLKWSAIGYFVYRYKDYCFPLMKWAFVAGCSSCFIVFWFRFGIYRALGPLYYERYGGNFLRTRFEQIFKDFSHLSTPSLIALICKTWWKWVLFQPHRHWLKSIQQFFVGFKPFTDVIGKDFRHGLSVRPLFVEHDGQFKSYFKWFVHKHDDHRLFGVFSLECEGNLHSRTERVIFCLLSIQSVTIMVTRLIVDPFFGGQVLKFDPIKLVIDDDWNAILLPGSQDSDDSLYNRLSFRPKTPAERLKLKNKKPGKIEESDYTPKT
ncbi:hypothetical protein RFI_26404, partial [Reticulomyxa filosa]